MRPGDRVRLKPVSYLRELFGPAADAVGIVQHVDESSVAWAIEVGYPDIPAYSSMVPAGEFEKIGDDATASGSG